jgi:hypothetical protein
MIPVRDDDIGGAVVRRRIDRGEMPPLLAGARLSRDDVLAMPVANRRSLVATERLWLLPRGDNGAVADRHMVHLGGGKYDVIFGVKMNDAPISKDEAEELATRPTL